MTSAQIRPQTLVRSIRAVAMQIRRLSEEIADGGAEPEDYEALEAWQAAADDLEVAYDKLALNVLNLPPYAELALR